MVYTICFHGDVEILEKLKWPLPRAPLIIKCCGLASGNHLWLKCQPLHITWPTLTYNLANPDIELGDHCVKNAFIVYIIIRLRFQGLSYLTRRVSLIEQELLTLPEHLSSSTVFSGVRALNLYFSVFLFIIHHFLSFLELRRLVIPLIFLIINLQIIIRSNPWKHKSSCFNYMSFSRHVL